MGCSTVAQRKYGTPHRFCICSQLKYSAVENFSGENSFCIACRKFMNIGVFFLFIANILFVYYTAQSEGTDKEEFVIEVPDDILQDSDSLVYSLYNTPILFQVVPPSDGNNLSVEADTMVVGFTLVDDNRNNNISGLLHPVIITLHSIRAQNNSVCKLFTCVCNALAHTSVCIQLLYICSHVELFQACVCIVGLQSYHTR